MTYYELLIAQIVYIHWVCQGIFQDMFFPKNCFAKRMEFFLSFSFYCQYAKIAVKQAKNVHILHKLIRYIIDDGHIPILWGIA